MTEKPRRLGRGLEALIASAAPPTASNATTTTASTPPSPLQTLALNAIRPNPYQPRRDFAPAELTELENSIKTSGLLQPVTVRQQPDRSYELVAGERRLRAATRLGWKEIPAIVKPFDDREMLTLALIENLQRADLNPLDEAVAYQRLMEDFSLTQQQVADAVGKDRSTVANLLRILQLPEGIRRLLRDNQISLGHARALLGMPNERAMLETARLIAERGLSVRDVERAVQDARGSTTRTSAPAGNTTGKAATTTSTSGTPLSAESRRFTEALRKHLQTDVRISADADYRGDISIRFYSADDLHRLLELVLNRKLEDS